MSQYRFLILSGQKMLKRISHHVDEWEAPLQVKRARISDYPLHQGSLLGRLLSGPRDHLWNDIYACDLIALSRQRQGDRSGSTCEVEDRPAKRPRPLLDEWAISVVALLLQIVGLWITITLQWIEIDHPLSLSSWLKARRQ